MAPLIRPFRILAHRWALIVGIILTCAAIGYTAADMIKAPYIAKSLMIDEKGTSDGSSLLALLRDIPKKTIATDVFYALPPEKQEEFKSFYHMDVSITGKMYDRYIGRTVDYQNRYDPATVLALFFSADPVPGTQNRIIITFSGNRAGDALFYTPLLMEAYRKQLVDAGIPAGQLQLIPALAEEDIREEAARICVLISALFGFLAGCIAAWMTEWLVTREDRKNCCAAANNTPISRLRTY